ncbi:MAG: HEAT repeat domain-containing protein [Myxococcales bacterium]
MRNVPGFADAVVRLRQGLGSKEPETAANAARALAPLHDLDAVPKLIELTAHEDRELAQAAADALREITKQTFGVNSGKWSAWWLKNGELPRAAWLVEALTHRELDIRIAAIDELVKVTADNLGFYADGPKAQRDEALLRWAEWLAGPGQSAPIE